MATLLPEEEKRIAEIMGVPCMVYFMSATGTNWRTLNNEQLQHTIQ
jgi:hypothetical protein